MITIQSVLHYSITRKDIRRIRSLSMKEHILKVKWYVLGDLLCEAVGVISVAFLPLASKMLFDTLAGDASWSYAMIVSLMWDASSLTYFLDMAPCV